MPTKSFIGLDLIMNTTDSMVPGTAVEIWQNCLPAILIICCLFVFFADKAFTIDDSLFLSQAQQIVLEPLQPHNFKIVWDQKFASAASIITSGAGMSYLLTPTILANGREWVGHLTVLLCLAATVLALYSLTRLLDFSAFEAKIATLLLVTMPTIMAMSTTVMPDIPAMTLGLIGVERLVMFFRYSRWHQALAGSLSMALSLFFRSHTILLLAILLLLLWLEYSHSSQKRHCLWSGLMAIGLSVSFAIFLSWLTRKTGHTDGSQTAMQLLVHRNNILPNLLALAVHYCLVVPLIIPWLYIRRAKISKLALSTGPVLAVSLIWITNAPIASWWAYLLLAAGLVTLLDLLQLAIRQKSWLLALLTGWLLIPVPLTVYVHLPSKYLTVTAPAVAMLILYITREMPLAARKNLFILLIAYGSLAGLLIIRSDAHMADLSRKAVAEFSRSLLKPGNHRWFSGDWSLYWYAQQAGIQPVTGQSPFPQPGDLIIWHRQPNRQSNRLLADIHLEKVEILQDPPTLKGHIMAGGAGFYSNAWGLLPWTLSTAPADTIVIGRVLP